VRQPRSAISLFLPLVIGSSVAVASLIYLTDISRGQGPVDEFALGAETTSYFAEVGGFPVHCKDLTDADACIAGYEQTTGDEVVVWLGNSQLHAINQMKEGEETAAAILHRKLKEQSRYLITFSQPNANLQEHYVLFEYLLTRLPIDTLVLPVVFDDMRESGIRPELDATFSNPEVVARLRSTGIGRALLANHGDHDHGAADNDFAALRNTVQETSEHLLNNQLESVSSVWASRRDLRGMIMISLYRFRNWVFGISASSTRKLIPGRYIANMQALEAILERAGTAGVKVLMYVVPLRDGVKIPYDIEQYTRFKDDVEVLAQSHNATLTNLEGLIPGELWGMKDSTTLSGAGGELDFMHFQADGHALLADALQHELQRLR
jgi:hypothetical protein